MLEKTPSRSGESKGSSANEALPSSEVSGTRYDKYELSGDLHWRMPEQAQAKSMRQAREKAIVDLVSSTDYKQAVLDLGCGDGALLSTLSEQSRMAIGVDLSEAGLVLAQRHLPRSPLIKSDVVFMPFKAGVFGLVLCADVIEHVADPLRLLSEVHRVLKPKGVFVLSTPNRLSPVKVARRLAGRADVRSDPRHVHEFSLVELKCILQQEGFTTRRVLGVGLDLPYSYRIAKDNEFVSQLLLKVGRLAPSLASIITVAATVSLGSGGAVRGHG